MDDTRGLVTVVIPTYNRAGLCLNAIRSALNQTYEPLEVIVVDDSSTDDTEAEVRRCEGPIRYVRQPRGGISVARNCGMDLAAGEFIAFLDDDDTWLPWKLSAQVQTLRRFPEVGMVWTDMVAVDARNGMSYPTYLRRMYSAYRYFRSEELFEVSLPCSEVWPDCPPAWAEHRCYVGDLFSAMFMGNLVHTSTVLLRRETQRAVGYFDPDLQWAGEDYDFHLRTSQLTPVAYLDLSSIHYRIGGSDQATETYANWIARNNLRTVMQTFERDRASLILPAWKIRRRLADSWAWVGRTELTIDRLRARAAFKQSLHWRPFDGTVACCYLLSFLPPAAIGSAKRYVRSLRALLART